MMLDTFRESMMAEFDMSHLGRMHYFLGIELNQSNEGTFICHKQVSDERL